MYPQVFIGRGYLLRTIVIMSNSKYLIANNLMLFDCKFLQFDGDIQVYSKTLNKYVLSLISVSMDCVALVRLMRLS